MKLNSMMKLATVAALVGGTTGCLGTGTDYSYVVSKTADDGAATVTTGSGTTTTANVSFINEITPILKTPFGNNGVACINCHVGVLNTANSTASGLQNMGASSNFVMAVVNPTTSNSKGLVGSGANGSTSVAIGTNVSTQFPADPSTLQLTTAGTAGRTGWNCDTEDFKVVKYSTTVAGAQSVFPIRAYAIAKLADSGNTSGNLGSRLVEKVGGSTYGLSLTAQRMPYASGTDISAWEYASAAQVDKVRTWVSQGAPCQ